MKIQISFCFYKKKKSDLKIQIYFEIREKKIKSIFNENTNQFLFLYTKKIVSENTDLF